MNLRNVAFRNPCHWKAPGFRNSSCLFSFRPFLIFITSIYTFVHVVIHREKKLRPPLVLKLYLYHHLLVTPNQFSYLFFCFTCIIIRKIHHSKHTNEVWGVSLAGWVLHLPSSILFHHSLRIPVYDYTSAKIQWLAIQQSISAFFIHIDLHRFTKR